MTPSKKILKLPLRISLALLLFGIMSKMFVWPFADYFLLISFSSLGVLYTLRFISKKRKAFLDYNKFMLVSFWTLYGVLTVMNFPYTLLFLIATAITFILWFVMEGTAYFLDEDRHVKNSLYRILWNFAMVIGTLAIISGSLLKILNWAYSIHLLSIGITMVAAYILKDVFVPETNSKDEQNHEEFQL